MTARKRTDYGVALAVLLTHTIVVMARFAVGKHLDGKNRSGCTFHERGTQGEAHWFGRGQASPWARLAGRERAAIRWTVLLICFGMLTARSQTEWALALIGGPAAGVLYWRTRRRWDLRHHRTQLVVPLAAALADKMGQDHAVIARHHLKIRADYTDAEPGDVIASYRHLPPHWAASRKDEAFIEHLFRSRIPVAMDFRWTTHTHPMRVEAVVAASPPTDVALADHVAHMDSLPPGVYFLGVSAKGELCVYDTCGEDPMIASGARTRKGKTNLHLGFASQGLRRGEEFYAVDPKRKSLLALRGVPGFHLANDPGNPEQMVGFIKGFARLLDEAIEKYAADPEQSPHRTLILEEMPRLFTIIDQWWDQVRGKDLKRNNPAWQAVRSVLNQGAEFHHRIMVCAQDLTDEVLFRSRNSFGTILMNGFKPQQWRNQIGTTPIPACPKKPGRFYLVRYGEPELIHVVCADSRPGHGRHNEQLWREYALGGRQPQTDTWTGEDKSGAWGQHEALPPVPDPEVLELSPLLIGPSQAAAYLGMTYDQFKMARRHHPIQGEVKYQVRGQDTSCWTKETLQLWAAEVHQNA
jgi:hypothetical protein